MTYETEAATDLERVAELVVTARRALLDPSVNGLIGAGDLAGDASRCLSRAISALAAALDERGPHA